MNLFIFILHIIFIILFIWRIELLYEIINKVSYFKQICFSFDAAVFNSIKFKK